MFAVSLSLTSVSHAALFASVSLIWMVSGKMLAAAAVALSPRLAACFGAAPPVPRMHVLCITACVLGVSLCFCDAPPPDTSAGKKPSALGDAVALVSALGASVYLTQAEALRPHVEPPVFFLAVELQCARPSEPTPLRPARRARSLPLPPLPPAPYPNLRYFCICLLVACASSPSPPTLDMDPQHGVFGWMQLSAGRLGCQVWITVAADLVGNLGTVLCEKQGRCGRPARTCLPLAEAGRGWRPPRA